MKKLIISLTAVLIALLVCFSVLADNSTPAAELYDSLVKTLFCPEGCRFPQQASEGG